ncbi:MAG: glutathione S-transferase [Rhodospirillales bacterium]|nr:glutathione S-transferase [Rhodospirillales bacterium]
MAAATLLISSKNYSPWSLRGHLLARLARLSFEEKVVSPDDPAMKAELLLQASSNRVPCLEHEGVLILDVLAIAEYLNETFPKAKMLPADKVARARCRAVSGEMHSGFSALRSSLPMNLRLHRPGFRLWSAAQTDVNRIVEIWRDCLTTWGGPWLFGGHPTIADAMYAPVVTRFRSYDVALDAPCEAYARHVMEWEPLQEWYAAAMEEPEQIEELDIEF